MRIGKRSAGVLATCTSVVGFAATAWAQPAPATAQPPLPAQALPPPSTAPEKVPDELLRVTPGGLTSEQVGQRAAVTSFNAKAQSEAVRGAAARVDEAWVAFLPRLTGTAQYTHLSNFTPGLITFGGMSFSAASLYPILTEQYLLQGSLAVPISDYFLRLTQNYSAATHSEQAARFDAQAARAVSAADGRVAFYDWLGARGSVIVAVQALDDQKAHLQLAQNQFAVGQVSRADVLQAQTNVSAAELQVVHAKNLEHLAEKQVRTAMHAKDEEVLSPGESLDVDPPAFQGNLPELTTEAMSARLEVKSIDANAAAAREQASAALAGQLPVLTGFADAIYANPNVRAFPPSATWFPTWDIGARLVWSPNDTFIGGSNRADLESRAAQLDAQKGTLRDSIAIEVTQTFDSVREADASLASAKQELASAEEGYRVTKELYNNGRATSTTLTDAETTLTRARLDLLTARVNARTSRVRLDHALARDVRLAGGPSGAGGSAP